MIRLGIIAASLVIAAPVTTAEPGRPESVRRGMPAAEVKATLGPPQRISRVILFRRHLEQWAYQDPPWWVEFNCVLGEEQSVTQSGRPE